MTFKEFKKLDLGLLFIFAIIAELASVFGLKMVLTPVYFSLSALITLIAIIRWGLSGVIVYIAPIIIRTIYYPENTLTQKALIYGFELGLFTLTPLFFIYFKNFKKVVQKELFLVIIYVLYGYLLIILGRTIGMSIIQSNLISNFLQATGSVLLELVIVAIAMALLSKISKEIILDVYQYIKLKEEGRNGRETN